MTFDTDKEWPLELGTDFDIAARPDAASWCCGAYNGPYNKMLSHCFGNGFQFMITPHLVDSTIFYTVFHGGKTDRPVFVMEVQNNGHSILNTRKYADKQMRGRYDDLLFECPIDLLYGGCVFGSKMRVYCGDKTTGAVTPPDFGKYHLADAWSVDIMSPEGFAEMKRIVSYIKENVASRGANVNHTASVLEGMVLE
ncbi:hypothetical protein C8R43DRAFT_1001604 [Mycena crocata]|nr:hypothetical protein C8R43DRAFT_1001604 [Mycena crocata]